MYIRYCYVQMSLWYRNGTYIYIYIKKIWQDIYIYIYIYVCVCVCVCVFICGKVCRSASGLKRPMVVHKDGISHVDPINPVKILTFVCHVCRRPCKLAAGLQSHLRTHKGILMRNMKLETAIICGDAAIITYKEDLASRVDLPLNRVTWLNYSYLLSFY